MAYTTDSLDDAIERAKTMAERMDQKFVVVSFRNRWRVITERSYIEKDRIVWRSWKKREPGKVLADTERHRELVRTLGITAAAEAIGVKVWQVNYAAAVYGWVRKDRGVKIDIEHMRRAMRTMTAKAYAESIGVMPTRIYTLCSRHDIERPIRDKRGRKRVYIKGVSK